MSAPSFLDCRQSAEPGAKSAPAGNATPAQDAALDRLRRLEAATILRRRKIAGVGSEELLAGTTEAPPPNDLVGLALSGGGVRSAAFNLGILQALSESGLLRYVDYLCSVSGGGYIAGHLTALACCSANDQSEHRPASFHDSAAARMGLADRQRLVPSQYRFRHMGDYLTDYVGFIWRYVMFTIPLLGWAACLLGIPATLAALLWRLCDLPIVRQYFDLIGLGQLGTALHVGDETPMAFLPSVLCFAVLAVLAPIRLLYPRVRGLRIAVRAAVIAWLVSLGISIAVYVGNGETSLGASAELQKIQTHSTWPLLIATLVSFLPLLAGRNLMQSGREHAPRWKKLVFHLVIGGASVSAAFLMVHLMARENISGFATHRDSRLLPDDIYDWNAFLGLFAAEGPLAGLIADPPSGTPVVTAQDVQDAEFAVRD